MALVIIIKCDKSNYLPEMVNILEIVVHRLMPQSTTYKYLDIEAREGLNNCLVSPEQHGEAFLVCNK